MNTAQTSLSPPKKRRRKRAAERVKTPLYRWFILPFTFGIYRLLASLIERLTPEQAYILARGLALAAWCGSRRHRHIALRNIELAYGERFTPRARARVARSSLQHFCMTVFDLLLLPRYYENERWREIIDLTPEQVAFMREVSREPGPVAFHTAHFGSWEGAAAFAGLWGRRLNFVYRPIDHPQLDDELRRLRTLRGNDVYTKAGALKGYTRTLRSGDWLGVIADQNAGIHAAFLDFFGIAASTEVSYFPLYQRFKPRVATFFLIRKDMRFRFFIEGFEEIKARPDADPREEALRLGQWYLHVIRRAAERYPEQYLWSHKRFTSRPPGAPSFYNANPGGPLPPEILAAQPRPPILPTRWRAP